MFNLSLIKQLFLYDPDKIEEDKVDVVKVKPTITEAIESADDKSNKSILERL